MHRLLATLAGTLLVCTPALCAPVRPLQAAPDTTHSLRLVNVHSQLALGVANNSVQAGSPAVQAIETGPAGSVDWHFVPQGNNQYLIVNLHTREILGISGASTADQAPAVQWADNSTPDHLWTILDAGNGAFRFRNVHSGLLLGIAAASLQPGAPAVQEVASGIDTLWTIHPEGLAYLDPAPANVAYTAGDYATIHDPSMIATGQDNFYLYSTHDGIHMHQSSNLDSFADVGDALSPIPAWTGAYTNGAKDLWAPDVSYRDGQYWMYYAASSFGSNNSAIGLATSPSGAPGSWNDSGSPVITLSDCIYANPIDPGVVVDNAGNPWLSFGSFYGDIYMLPLDRTTGRLAPNSGCSFLARRYDTAIEGAYILHQDGAYYLFESLGVCCQGVNSTYRIVVGRSSSVTGPYFDQGGLPMTVGGGTILLSTHANIIGPGGESVLALPTGDLLVYHYYDGNNNGISALGMNWLRWQNGWPVLSETP